MLAGAQPHRHGDTVEPVLEELDADVGEATTHVRRPGAVQSSTSSPSCATSTPARRTAARSGERSSSTGFVLLMWIRITRGPLSFESVSSVPPGPESGTWPICRAVRDEI